MRGHGAFLGGPSACRLCREDSCPPLAPESDGGKQTQQEACPKASQTQALALWGTRVMGRGSRTTLPGALSAQALLRPQLNPLAISLVPSTPCT